ncbi:hypothetical protein B0A78_01865 [Flavobacterium columnare NBRC 100251 = ATCC 23463]|uniref:Uncharacterized protein n=1 Tax=Flavobacterium columnare (strain ATCC 49512 / CIP 103533 / TG 44/87) TaxID=1041826 RepID=G8XBF1_FLACA|nr:hypothetical protein [Flavobacterium columnare]AEW86731.1 hypothetical protein FCOL_09610 [Flavobacterium columnare ATCC 49512]ANO47144.1 hypothetical protein Pf1_01687 [Flavobacterium columnare]APT22173.1 hypothetical protein BU993_05715 [Flavobacterium columnare]PDS26595.1 hypothetical protein B0A78_01865 [Flavobacterium columnare NBRC 100251 = ATCC 23463]GEM58455.1 hypothetical protein FC1_16930 [Flavobacterium columnare NBRC 100251 = ATCC 23463]
MNTLIQHEFDINFYLIVLYQAHVYLIILLKLKKFIAPQNTDLILSEAQKKELYHKLIEQLLKDFLLANEDLNIPHSISPIELKIQVHKKIHQLIHNKFNVYLNLLYIIDVNEDEIKKLDGFNSVELAEQVSYLILKREWQKVWYKNLY